MTTPRNGGESSPCLHLHVSRDGLCLNCADLIFDAEGDWKSYDADRELDNRREEV